MLALAGCANFGKRTAAPGPAAKGPAAAQRAPDKGDPQARFNAALELMKQKKLPDAEAAFAALTKDFPQFSGPYTNLGILYAKSNRTELALAAFARATSLNRSNAVAWNWLGLTQRESGDRAGAEQSYLKAIQARPDYALAHLNLGILYDMYLNRPADALVQYMQYRQLAGKDELRVAAWIAELEAKQPAAAGAGAPATAPAAPPKAAEPQGSSFLPSRKP